MIVAKYICFTHNIERFRPKHRVVKLKQVDNAIVNGRFYADICVNFTTTFKPEELTSLSKQVGLIACSVDFLLCCVYGCKVRPEKSTAATRSQIQFKL